MSQTAKRRRCMIVDGKLQKRLVFSFTWPSAVGLLVTAGILGLFSVRLSDAAERADVALEGVTGLFFAGLGFLVAVAAFSVMNAVKYSQRIAGPLYRIAKTLASVRAGHIGARVHLRDGDFLTSVADDLNHFLGWLEQHPPTGVDLDTDVEGVSPQTPAQTEPVGTTAGDAAPADAGSVAAGADGERGAVDADERR